MSIIDAIKSRRTTKRFTEREIPRDIIEELLETAVHAPNHRLTQPWRFYVLGPEARYNYGLALGTRKAKKFENDPEAAAKMRETVAQEHRALPAMIAVAVVMSQNPEIGEEDYAAAMMSVQNLSLAAFEKGLATAIRTGAVMADPAARAAAGVKENERIVAIVNLGEAAETPPAKGRTPAADVTSWVP
jgi:nitroreductase